MRNAVTVDTNNEFVRTKITNTKQSEQSTNAPAITQPTPLVRAEVIAKHFDVHVRTVAMWAQNGVIPCVRLGGALRFNLEAVLEVAR